MQQAGPRNVYLELGGEAWLRPIIARFVARMYVDPMIGFFFAGIRQQRIENLELSHAAAHLGHDVPYAGRPLAKAHARHPITGGHFARRLRLLDEVLLEAAVPADVRLAWLEAQEQARGQIVQSGPQSACPADS